ncbi:alpha/beta hydrolase [Pleurocapsa sp. CCALA 161]|uniref:alpha/beta hydrolase n=1 Tax=Pleurocapsa sp. CCALA 161 TaxID=2107688 RepID=UPI001304914C|nr:alpha/beta hydrolase [Pleurocapsa sp. CCALA 161]
MRKATGLKWLRQVAIAFISAGALIFFVPSRASGSEKVIFTDGGLSQSISLEELQDFADTGKVSPALNTLLKHGQQNPFVIRRILRQEFPANNRLISDLLNTIPGEYILSQTGNVVSSRTEIANVTALRGALVTSASDNNLISLIELLENYPTQEVYVNGKILFKLRENFVNFVEGSSQYLI